MLVRRKVWLFTYPCTNEMAIGLSLTARLAVMPFSTGGSDRFICLMVESVKEAITAMALLLPCRPVAKRVGYEESDSVVNNKSLIINRLFKGLFLKHTRTVTQLYCCFPMEAERR